MNTDIDKIKVQGKHQDLWATRIWHFDLSALKSHFSQWSSLLTELRAGTPSPAGRSNRYGWNSDKTIFQVDEFADLHRVCKQVFLHAFKEMGLDPIPKFQLEAWANIHDPGGFNVSHIHQNCWLSGCFYLEVPEGAGAIVLRDPRPGALTSPFRTRGCNSYQEIRVTPQPGLLLVFPNWLEHHVEPNDSEGNRVSIAMNALQG